MDYKDKANDLCINFLMETDIPIKSIAKQCALICVDEIINESSFIDVGYSDSARVGKVMDNRIDYWNEVKQEIEKL